MIILPVLDFTIFPVYNVLRHESKKREINPEEFDVVFDQFVEGNSCI